ncbi:MAG: hypothetical protein B7Z80_14850 [Rhodospirillales bacterium 20-64-7]|nr:MAG: hypothetical protein B7Z80_14850 [Rhodospirillales bacterium 20-64-7]
MPGPIEATGIARTPTKYGALTMGSRQYTGLWTQRSPYRDADVRYLVSKFYSGSRFDSILDGINREISPRMTNMRAPGSSVWNDNVFPGINSFCAWKYIQDQAEVIRILVDGIDGNIYDASNGGKTILATKSGSAGPARFLGVNTELFIGDGVDQKKVIGTAKTWQAGVQYNTGDLIVDSNGNLQQAFSVALTVPVATVQMLTATGAGGASLNLTRILLQGGMNFPSNYGSVTLSGLSYATWLNGVALTNIFPLGATGNAFQAELSTSHTAYGPATDTGVATGMTLSGSGTSGATEPTWATAQLATTGDGQITWRCFGDPTKDWGLPAPTAMPTAAPYFGSDYYWRPNTAFGQYAVVVDSLGQYQVEMASGTPGTGFQEPKWPTTVGAVTWDGGQEWWNAGVPSGWLPNMNYPYFSAIVDNNGNLQVLTASLTPTGTAPVWSQAASVSLGVQNTFNRLFGGSSHNYTANSALVSAGAVPTTGSSAPAWRTVVGATTVDNNYTWTCCGPIALLASATLQYSASFHGIDGSVSTAAPLNATVINGVLGNPTTGFAIELTGATPVGEALPTPTSTQIDAIWIWRTAAGQATPLLLATIPLADNVTPTWTYVDMLPDAALIVEIPAPLALTGNPPPTGFLPSGYIFERVFGFQANLVIWSGGPDTITGNGNTAFPPTNFIAFPAKVVRVWPLTVQNGGLLVFTTDGVWLILGTGTANNPFYATPYFPSVSVLGFNAMDVFNNSVFLMEANGKVSMLAIQYPFNPQGGYTEIGFPIGDQFKKVTTGGISAALYNPATAYVSWNMNSSADTGMYVADGAVGWFRMGQVQAPESGVAWSPRRAIAGGTSAVQNVEIAPGVEVMLIGPPSATPGPILQRDTTGTVWTDNGVGYPAWDAKGVNLLCSTGQWAEVAHISAKSMPVGARPIVSVLLGEIGPSTARPWDVLEVTSNDPPDTPRILSAFSDRYDLLQNGVATTGDCILTKFDYGTQACGDELLDWAIFAGMHDERVEEATNVK